MTNKVVSVQIEPLSAEAFLSYGRLIEHCDEPGRQYVPEAFEREPELTTPTMWMRRVRRRRELPVLVTHMERHPYSAQTFLPTRPFVHLVAVCLAQCDGRPDISSLRVFVAGPGQGVCYRRNIWHHELTVLTEVADFVVLMSLTGRGDDDVFLELNDPVEVHDQSGVLKEAQYASCV